MSSWLLWLITFIVSATAVFVFRQKKKGVHIFIASILIGGVAIGLVAVLPYVKETVELKALGTANSEASQTEIVINSVTAEGKAVEIEPVSGKWFWRGSQYMWRPENDNRKPEGVTAAVSLHIPVGLNRSIQLEYGPWRGVVEIAYDGTTVTVDTYSPEKKEMGFDIPSTSGALLLQDIGGRILIFICLYAVGALFAYVIWTDYGKYPEKYKKWFNAYKSILAYSGVATMTFILMISYSGQASFWGDEMIMMGILSPNNNLLDVLRYNINLTDATPPLFNLLAYLWYQIVPYGETWLRLFPEASTAIGIVFVGLCGERLKKNLGIWGTVIAATSTLLMLQCGYEFRSYCLLFLFSAVTFERYINRFQCAKHQKNLALVTYGISMLLLAFSHYYGILICFVYFAFDFYLYIRKIITVKNIISYLIMGIPTCGYLLMVLVSNTTDRLSYPTWYSKPTLTRWFQLYDYLNGTFILSSALFLVGIFTILLNWKKKKSELTSHLKAIALLQLFLCPALMFLLGRLLPASYWLERYFVGLLPFAFLVSAYSIAKMLDISTGESKLDLSSNKFIAVFISGVLVCNAFNIVSANKGRTSHPYRQASEWLISQNDIYVPSTAVLVTRESVGSLGFNEYYIGQNGKRDLVNVLSTAEIETQDLNKYNTIYAFEPGQALSSPLKNYLKENFNVISTQSALRVTVYQSNKISGEK